MFVFTSKDLGESRNQYLGFQSGSYIGEVTPPASTACSAYEKGEKELSWCQTGSCRQGHLAADVSRHPRGLLIADFGVGWSGMKAATKSEKLLQDWLREAKADLYSIVLGIYGYSDCIGKEKNNADLRQKRAMRVYGLLDKDLQSRVDFIRAAPAGAYIADNTSKEGRAKNRGVIIELYRLPTEVIEIKSKAPRPIPCTGPSCKSPPPPPKKPTQQRNWKLVGKYSWKGKRRRLAKKGYFEIFGEPEVEATVSVNTTDAEFATFAVKWEKGKGPGGEFETQLGKWFVPDLKIERDDGKWIIAFKKEIALLGGKTVIKPHLQISTEVVKTEVVFVPFIIPFTLYGQDIKIAVEPKVNVIVKVDLLQVLIDRLRNKLKDWLNTLLKDLLAWLGRGVLGSLLGKVLAGLLGGVLAKVFISKAPTNPVTAPANDVNGKKRALALVAGTSSAAQILQTWANTHRHAFAKAYADTMLQLCGPQWKDRLEQLRSLTLNGYKALPAAKASDAELLQWAANQRALDLISIDLKTDNYAKRFRWYELMLMFALAAWILRRITKAEVDQAKGLALKHASVAGMAAALQYVNRQIAANTFEFIDENDKTQTANGTQRWDAISQLVRSSGLSDAEISLRLEQLGLEQLPRL